jgi:hypothetical protein
MTVVENQNQPFVSFILIGKDLIPQEITDSLQITPSKSFRRGDLRTETKKWPHGYWALESTNNVASPDLVSHLEWLIKQLEPVKLKLTEVLKGTNIKAEISCFWILSEQHYSLSLSNMLLRRIADFGIEFELDIHCPD